MQFITILFAVTPSLGSSLSVPLPIPLIPSGLSVSSSAPPGAKPEVNSGTIPTAWRHTHGTRAMSSEPASTTDIRHNSCLRFCTVNPWLCRFCIPGEETRLKDGAHEGTKRFGGKDAPAPDNHGYQYEMGDCIPGFSWGF